ncbi:MAG: cofactor-independent phosphoglycerate mutase [Firmicutes bacterium]|nr:cofactor-independent phosphoglycerate mutase [Bacillota bacterium]
MKYVVVLGDGMADYPLDALGGRTPLQVAAKPHIDALAKKSLLGLVKTVPSGLAPGSDTANLAVLGYDPLIYYNGRSPFEAISMGVPLQQGDITFRCNFVTLSVEDNYEDRVMLDHSADEISSTEARLLLADIDKELQTEKMHFFPGVSYRHLLVWQGAPTEWTLTPPHDILARPIGDYLPKGPLGAHMLALMEKSAAILADHPVNVERVAKGLRPANSIWIWGEGQKPQLPSFAKKYGVRGAVISAVDLIKGLGLAADLEVIYVEGATGNLQTNFRGKANAALVALQQGMDFVYIHVEAPDECGHRQEMENKIKAIELIDQQVVAELLSGLDATGEDYRMMILPDHATPLALRTHTSDPVPFLIYDSTAPLQGQTHCYDEGSAKDAGLMVGEGYTLMDLFFAASVGGK